MAKLTKARRAELRVAIKTQIAKVLREPGAYLALPHWFTPDDREYANTYLRQLADSYEQSQPTED